VLGQPGHNQIEAGLAAADAMVDRIAGHSRRPVRTMPDLPKRTLAPGTAPRSHRSGSLSVVHDLSGVEHLRHASRATRASPEQRPP
jgi:hypothetical protein